MTHPRTKKLLIGLAWRFAVIIFFFMCASILVIYAGGYKVNISNRSVEATGAIQLLGDISNIQVVIDGQPVATKLPFSLTGLEPGRSYDVKVQKDGFATWHAQARIEAGRVVTLGKIRLFPTTLTPVFTDAVDNKNDVCNKNTPSKHDQLTVQGGEIRAGTSLVTRLSVVPTDVCWFNDESHIAYVTEKSLHVLDKDGSNDIVLALFDQDVVAVMVASNNDHLSIQLKDGRWMKLDLP